MNTAVTLADGSRVRLTRGELNAIRKLIEANGRAGIQWLPPGVKWRTRWSLYEKGVLVSDPADRTLYRFAEDITLPDEVARLEKPEKTRAEVLAIAATAGELPPVRLRKDGGAFYTWSNGKDVLSPKRLSANIYRSRDHKRYPWVIRYFLGGNAFKESVHMQEGISRLRTVRQILTRVGNAFDPPDEMHHTSVVYILEDIARAARGAANDVEFERLYGKDDEDVT